MGQQQLLLIILGVIIVGIAIAVGLSLFTAQSIQSNKDAIIDDINNIAASAYQYRIRPGSMGGGSNSYTNYFIPVRMTSNENGTYTATVGADAITLQGSSVSSTDNWVKGIVGSNGRVTMGSSSFNGDFM